MTVYSVSDFVSEVNELLTSIPALVEGEISNFHVAQNRFVWFDLKDDKSVVSCFMLAFQLKETFSDGVMVQVKGTPALFTKSGRFHLRAQTIQLVGEGNLKKQYEQLRAKLAAEGLFDTDRKRVLPRFPKTIGLVTSPDAAAYTDVQRILKNRWAGLDIKLFPVHVQGDSAVSSLFNTLQSIKTRWSKQLDLVIITRGGGSMEDLQAFNNEAVVRAIFALDVPTIVAIGHERDNTLAEYAADMRASTPSNAAELAVPHKTDVLYQISQLLKTQYQCLQRNVQQHNDQVRLATSVFDNQITQYRSTVEHYARLLLSYHPERILQRGYSITTLSDGTVLTSAKQAKMGSKITTKLRTGTITSQVI